MKRILVEVLVAASVLLALPAATLAAEWHDGVVTGGKGGADGLGRLGIASLPREAAARAGFLSLGAVLSGSAELNGHVYSLYGDGSPETPYVNYLQSDAEVAWYVDSAEGSGSGNTVTDMNGAYTLGSVAPATGNGIVRATNWLDPDYPYPSTLSYVDRSWADGSASTYDFGRGLAGFDVTTGGPFKNEEQGSAWWTMRGTDAGGGIESFVPHAGSLEDVDVRLQALPGTYTDVCANWHTNEGMEKTADFAVASAALTSTGITFNQAVAQRLWEVVNYTPSGDPGSVVKLRLQNFPADEVTDLYGYQYEPAVTLFKSLGSLTAKALANQYKRVTVPASALPGQDYVIGGHHRGGLLDLEVYFQVTRLKGPSAARGSYRLTGQVPIAGYTGAPGDTGASKWVYLYRRFTAASQPKGDPTRLGWKSVRRYRTDATGKFGTYSMNPGRTAWYVVYYGADADNWQGFTSVRRVRHY
jgi:hypothetical protein